jgi:hypothetical protein
MSSHRTPAAPPGTGGTSARPLHDPDWDTRTAGWVAEGIIDADQARRIVALEAARGSPRSTLLAEVLGYLGAALVVAALAALMSDRWSDIPLAGQIAIVAVATAVGAVTGAVARRREGAAFTRMASLLWLATVGGVAGLTVLVASDGLDLTDDVTLVCVLAAAAAAAVAFYVLLPGWLQMVAVVGTTTGVVASVLNLAGVDFSPVYGFVLLAIGTTWVLQAFRPLLGPASAATIAGAVAYFIGSAAISSEWTVAGFALLAVGAIAMLVSSVLTRNILFLVLGALGLFQSLPQLAVELFGESIGAALALLVAGAVIIVVALRLRRPGGGPQPPGDGLTPTAGVTPSAASPTPATRR